MLLHKAVQTSNGKAQLTRTFTPSRGPIGSFAKIVNRLYFRRAGKGNRAAGFRALPPGLSSHLLQKLERRNAVVRRVRYALAGALLLALVLLARHFIGS